MGDLAYVRSMSEPRYGLVTAAHNEELYIDRVIRSVTAQTLLPVCWVIVSDGSTDRTNDIVESYTNRADFIRLVRLERPDGRNFGAKVKAVRIGFEVLRPLELDFVGNLDADISVGPEYFRTLLEKFRTESRLGLAGGWIYEEAEGKFRSRPFNSPEHVPHALQVLRRACYESIGDYLPLPYGGEDTHAVVSAQMRGWKTESFRDLPAFHHRPTSSAGGVFGNHVRMGFLDYSLGYSPAFEILKAFRRLRERPWAIGAILRLLGFGYAYLRNEPRSVSPEFVRFLRATQKNRMRSALGFMR